MDLRNCGAGQDFLVYLNDWNHLNVIETSMKNQLSLKNYFHNVRGFSAMKLPKLSMLWFRILDISQARFQFQNYGKTIILNSSIAQPKVEEQLTLNSPKSFHLRLDDGREIELFFQIVPKKPDHTSQAQAFPELSSQNDSSPLKSPDHLPKVSKEPLSPKGLGQIGVDQESPFKTGLTGMTLEADFTSPLNFKQKSEGSLMKLGTKSTRVSPFGKLSSPGPKSRNGQVTISSFFATPNAPGSNQPSFNTPASKARNSCPNSHQKRSSNHIEAKALFPSSDNVKYVVCFSNLSNARRALIYTCSHWSNL